MDYPKADDPNFTEKRRAYMREYQRRLNATPEGKAANKARKKKYRSTRKGRATDRAYRKTYQRDPEKARAAAFKHHHGVARDDADAMAAKQKNLCAICKNPPRGKGHHGRLHVDHCWKTDKVRGMLCARCNMALGLMDHSIKTLRIAIGYLKI